MKKGPDTRSDSREPVRIDIYLNMFILISLVYILGMSWSFSSPKATEVLLHVFGICLHFQGASPPVSSVSFACIYMLA